MIQTKIKKRKEKKKEIIIIRRNIWILSIYMYPLPLQSGSTSHPKKVSSTLSPPQIPASQTPSKPTPPPKNINLRQIYIFFQSHKTLLNRPLLWFPQLQLHTLHIHFSINHPKKNSNRHPKPKPKPKPKSKPKK